ncbi:MAG: hypothetical protein WC464_08080 [Bdellovibrionales bacterium]
MRLPFLIVMSLGIFVFSSPQAQAALVGSSCAQSGKTQMDTDGKNIIACVCKTIANCGPSDLVWKAMAGPNISCPSGQGLTGIVNGVPQCSTLGVFNYSCPSGTAASSIVNGVPQCTPVGVINLTCPSGQYVLNVVNGVTSCATPPVETCCGTFQYSSCRGTAYSYACISGGRAKL